MAGHRRHPKKQTGVLTVTMHFGIEKRSHLRERVVQDIRQPVSGMDQTVAGVSPAKGPLI